MADPNQPAQQPSQPDTSGLAALLAQGTQPKATLGDIVNLIQEMRARRDEQAKVSASPLADLLGGLIRSPQVASGGGTFQGAIGARIAAMTQDRMNRQMMSDLTSGKLIPLNQLQSPPPQQASFLDDLAQLGISPQDFRGLLGLKPPAAATPQAPVQPQSNPNDPNSIISQFLMDQQNKTGSAQPMNPSVMQALNGAGYSTPLNGGSAGSATNGGSYSVPQQQQTQADPRVVNPMLQQLIQQNMQPSASSYQPGYR